MPFTTPLRIEKVDSKNWRYLTPHVYVGEFDEFVIPAGMWTDFGSVPRIAWPIVSPIGLGAEGYGLHDALYRFRGVSPWLPQGVTRLDADGILRRVLNEAGVGDHERRLVYFALRMFGDDAWDAHREREKRAPLAIPSARLWDWRAYLESVVGGSDAFERGVL